MKYYYMLSDKTKKNDRFAWQRMNDNKAQRGQ